MRVSDKAASPTSCIRIPEFLLDCIPWPGKIRKVDSCRMAARGVPQGISREDFKSPSFCYLNFKFFFKKICRKSH